MMLLVVPTIGGIWYVNVLRIAIANFIQPRLLAVALPVATTTEHRCEYIMCFYLILSMRDWFGCTVHCICMRLSREATRDSDFHSRPKQQSIPFPACWRHTCAVVETRHVYMPFPLQNDNACPCPSVRTDCSVLVLRTLHLPACPRRSLRTSRAPSALPACAVASSRAAYSARPTPLLAPARVDSPWPSRAPTVAAVS